MKNITIYEEYNISSDKMIDIMTSTEYYNYLLNVTDDLLSYEIKSLKKEGIYIYMELSYELLINLPDFLKKILTNLNKFKFNESIIYNLKENTINVDINSKIFNLGKCKCNYNYKLIDIGKNKISKDTTFYCDCSIPIIGSRIEEVICNKTIKKNKTRYGYILEYIKNIEE